MKGEYFLTIFIRGETMGYLSGKGNTFAMEALECWQQRRASVVDGQDFTQEKLALRMGIHLRTLTDMLHGYSLPRLSTLARFCEELGVDAARQHRWEELVRKEKGTHRTAPQMVGFLYAGVEETAHFWYRAASAMTKSVDDKNLLRLPDTDIPQYGVTAFCHREHKSLMLAHLRYCKALGDNLAGLVIVPAYGVEPEGVQYDDALVGIIDLLLNQHIPMVFIDRKMLVSGTSVNLTDRAAVDFGNMRGIKLVTVDGYGAGRLAVHKLLEAKHSPEKIAIAGDIQKISTINERYLGASQALFPHLPYNARQLVYFGTDYADVTYGQQPYLLNEVVKGVLNSEPTGIVALTSQLALLIQAEVQRLQKQHALRMPAPVIISLDDVPELGDSEDIPRYPYSPWLLVTRAIQVLRNIDVDNVISFDHLRGAIRPPIN